MGQPLDSEGKPGTPLTGEHRQPGQMNRRGQGCARPVKCPVHCAGWPQQRVSPPAPSTQPANTALRKLRPGIQDGRSRCTSSVIGSLANGEKAAAHFLGLRQRVTVVTRRLPPGTDPHIPDHDAQYVKSPPRNVLACFFSKASSDQPFWGHSERFLWTSELSGGVLLALFVVSCR